MSIDTLLVANRGEIARRLIRACRARGIRVVAVYADPDRGLPYVREADLAVRIGPGPARESYLRADAILDVARRTGADAIHPGYGFLAENADFADAVIAAGLTWVGPSGAAMRALGDKAAARRVALACGVPVVPGYDGEAQDAATFVREAARIGAPVLLKASAGGGGRGMRRVDDLARLPEALESARREAEASFGDGRLLLERYVLRPRHLEVQVFGDRHGRVVHFGERECSIQRRHQKIVEEAPAPGLSESQRAALCDAAVRLARHVGYENAGTCEFVVDPDGAFYFLEMNTRLQVEHPVTEEAHGVDLVQLQLDVAEGRPLPAGAGAAPPARAAIEVRVCAEDPARDFLPATGTLVAVDLGEDGPTRRIEAGFASGDVVSPHYDSMIAKVIATGATRDEAVRALTRAVDAAWVAGVATNLPLLRDIARDAAFRAGDLDTGFLGRRDLPRTPPSNLARGAAVVAAWRAEQGRTREAPAGWRLCGAEPVSDRYGYAEEAVTSRTAPEDAGWRVAIEGEAEPRRVAWLGRAPSGGWIVDEDGVVRTVRIAAVPARPGPPEDGDTVYLHLGDAEACVRCLPRFAPPAGLEDEPGACVAPTPAIVRAVHVEVGATVDVGAALVTLEAMKMEQTLKAGAPGVVSAVRVGVGQAVEAGALLVRIDLA
jgi:acetyl/propionyl-CoA carboxylase alpha subunit